MLFLGHRIGHRGSTEEVEVAGEIHFLQNARLEGSLRFRKAKGEVPSGHRCVDVGDAQKAVGGDLDA